MSEWQEFDEWYSEHGWKYVSSREGAFVVWKSARGSISQRLQELEFALAETEALELAHGERIENLTAERDVLKNALRRSYVELFHCNQQLTGSFFDEDGEPLYRTGKSVSDSLKESKLLLESIASSKDGPY